MLNGTFYVKNAIQYNLQQQMFVTSWNKILQEFIPVCLQMSDSEDARERALQELQNRRGRFASPQRSRSHSPVRSRDNSTESLAFSQMLQMQQ